MIGLDHLGRMGRLGNQMFQYAALRGIAAHRGFEFCIPQSTFRDEWKHHQLFEAFKLEGLQHVRLLIAPWVLAKTFQFDRDLFENAPDGRNIYGWLQTEKYFAHIAGDIRRDFQFKDEICERAMAFVERLDQPISIHVRRGDYVGDTNFAACSREYYEAALSHFDRDRQVLVFSDDPDWCREEFQDARFVISAGNDNVTDLCMMSLCSGQVIANSSFSWWGAWLSGSDSVFAPKAWFAGDNAGIDTSDLVPERWNRV